jgi:co-chaperonin GroES (HSP10)
MNIKMFGDKLLLKKDVVELKEEKSPGGIYIPQQARPMERVSWATVIVVGNEAKNVNLNDRVLFDALSTSDIVIEGVGYLIVREQDLIGAATI